jgi:hypothetical protein
VAGDLGDLGADIAGARADFHAIATTADGVQSRHEDEQISYSHGLSSSIEWI